MEPRYTTVNHEFAQVFIRIDQSGQTLYSKDVLNVWYSYEVENMCLMNECEIKHILSQSNIANGPTHTVAVPPTPKLFPSLPLSGIRVCWSEGNNYIKGSHMFVDNISNLIN
jgi:hypothetical protein